jgi:vesicle coat complex subunit
MEKEMLIEVLDKLLHDRTSLVLGSTIMAFEEICPDRFDLIHKHFRKLCNTLVDVDEWGQIVILGMLARYVDACYVTASLFCVLHPSSRTLFSHHRHHCAAANAEQQSCAHLIDENQFMLFISEYFI